jgi:capsular exopolysaccharide synthesis family protein
VPHAGPRVANAPGDDVLGTAHVVEGPPLPDVPLVHAEPVCPGAIDPHVVSLHDPAGEIAEQYRAVRTRLMTGNPEGGARALCVTSSLPREGKTTTTANLGFSLAELRHLRVAMVDLDFRKRGLTRMLQLSEQSGIAEVLRGEKRLAEVCVPAVRGNLFVIPTGDPGDASPSDLLGDDATARVFRELNTRFHYSLVDTPPVSTAADIGLVAPVCHSVIMVVRMNRTPEAALRRCVRALQANGVNIAGCVLAGYDPSASGPDGNDYYGPAT